MIKHYFKFMASISNYRFICGFNVPSCGAAVADANNMVEAKINGFIVIMCSFFAIEH